MTTDNNESNDDLMSELTGQWFDAESQEEEIDSSPAAEVDSLDVKQRRHAADLQLVHSLLTQLSDRDQDAKEQQIRQLMERIDQGADGDRSVLIRFTRLARPLVRYGIAALILLALVVFMTQTSTVTATTAMAQMIAAIDQAGDRIYTIRIEGSRQEEKPPRRERFDLPPEPREDRSPDIRADDRRDRRPQPFDRPPERTREPGERAVLDGSTLYLRGRTQFVLFRPTPSGKVLINGCDGQTSWMIRPEKPVMVSSDLDAFPIPMPKELAAILSLDFKATLQHISERYRVKHLDDTTTDEYQDSSRIYLDAVKASRDFAGPQNIELWSEAQTGLLLRIEFAGIHVEDYPSPVRLIIELTDQTPLADNWFTRQTHHSLDAEVYDVSGERPDAVPDPDVRRD